MTTEVKQPYGTTTATQNPPSARRMAPRFTQKVRTKINSHHPPPLGAWTMVGSSVIIGVNTSLYHLLWLLTLALRSHISSKSVACSLQMPKQIERMPDFGNMHCNPPYVDIEPPHSPATHSCQRHNGACSRLENKVVYDSRRSFRANAFKSSDLREGADTSIEDVRKQYQGLPEQQTPTH